MYEILFQYRFVTVKTFHLFLALSFVVGFLYLIKFIGYKKMKIGFISDYLIYLLIIPIIGGRLFYIFENLSSFKNNYLNLFTGVDLGLSGFGLLYTFFASLYFLTRKNNLDFWSWLDAFVVSGVLGMSLIHIGHFFNGTNFGRMTNLPWGVSFDTINIPFIKPIHPTQIYSAIIALTLFNLLTRFVKRTHLTGLAGNLGIMIYSISAFGIDFLHGEPSSYARFNYLLMAAISFIFYTHCSHRKLLS